MAGHAKQNYLPRNLELSLSQLKITNAKFGNGV